MLAVSRPRASAGRSRPPVPDPSCPSVCLPGFKPAAGGFQPTNPAWFLPPCLNIFWFLGDGSSFPPDRGSSLRGGEVLPWPVTRGLRGRLPSPVLFRWRSCGTRCGGRRVRCRMALLRAPRPTRNGGLGWGPPPAGRAGVSQAEAAAVPPGPAAGGRRVPQRLPCSPWFPFSRQRVAPGPRPGRLPRVTRARSDTQSFILTVTRGPGPGAVFVQLGLNASPPLGSWLRRL